MLCSDSKHRKVESVVTVKLHACVLAPPSPPPPLPSQTKVFQINTLVIWISNSFHFFLLWKLKCCVWEKNGEVINSLGTHFFCVNGSRFPSFLFCYRKLYSNQKRYGSAFFFAEVGGTVRCVWQGEKEVITSLWTHFCCQQNQYSNTVSLNKFNISITLLRKMQRWVKTGQPRKIESLVTMKSHGCVSQTKGF